MYSQPNLTERTNGNGKLIAMNLFALRILWKNGALSLPTV